MTANRSELLNRCALSDFLPESVEITRGKHFAMRMPVWSLRDESGLEKVLQRSIVAITRWREKTI